MKAVYKRIQMQQILWNTWTCGVKIQYCQLKLLNTFEIEINYKYFVLWDFSDFVHITFSTMRATDTATDHSILAAHANFEIDHAPNVTHLCCVVFVLQVRQQTHTLYGRETYAKKFEIHSIRM
jgi:hypothetical protein